MDEEELERELGAAWDFVAPYWPESAWLQAVAILAIGLGIALFAELMLRLIAKRLASRTRTELDDRLVKDLQGPLLGSVMMYAGWWAFQVLEAPKPFPYFVRGVLFSGIVVTWTLAARRFTVFAIKRYANDFVLLNARTQPVVGMTLMLATYGLGAYLLFLAWDLDLTAWIASAGIAGIAIGFAAQDTLANLFAGISIIVDAPYKIGDFIVVNGTKGRVVAIGMRSTRIRTLDNVEIVIPNSNMASADLVNESGGAGSKMRVSTTVEAAYGSDLDLVRRTLREVTNELPHVLDDPEPAVHFTAFGASGLEFKLRVWIATPAHAPAVLDQMNDLVYRAFDRAGISIPYQTVDVNLFPQPAPPAEKVEE